MCMCVFVSSFTGTYVPGSQGVICGRFSIIDAVLAFFLVTMTNHLTRSNIKH